jgi:hypothetical protein
MDEMNDRVLSFGAAPGHGSGKGGGDGPNKNNDEEIREQGLNKADQQGEKREKNEN